MGAKSNEGSLKDMVYESMLNAILVGEYLPGQPFTEKELTLKYNISKSPIREALIELCNEGILRSIPRYGYEVLKIDKEQVVEAKEVRLMLECNSLRMYFNRLDESSVQYLLSILNETEAKDEDPGLFSHWDKNSRFHIALMECYGNRLSALILEKTLIIMKRAYAQYQYRVHRGLRFPSSSGSHHKVIECISKGNMEDAVKALEEDILAFDTSFLA